MKKIIAGLLQVSGHTREPSLTHVSSILWCQKSLNNVFCFDSFAFSMLSVGLGFVDSAGLSYLTFARCVTE